MKGDVLPLGTDGPGQERAIGLRAVPDAVFGMVIRFPWAVIVVCMALVLAATAFLPSLTRDTSADGFIDPASPALLHRQTVEDVFGLRDPIVVALFSEETDGIYTPEALSLVETLTERLSRVDYIDPDRVTSLATENSIAGREGEIVIAGFFEDGTDGFGAPFGTAERAAEIAGAVKDFPLYNGTLVAKDGSATVIALELLEPKTAATAYEAVMKEVALIDLPEGMELHVAGDGAVSGFLSRYIDRDMLVLNPLAGAVIALILIAAFRSWRGAVLPNLIIVGTVLSTFGLMAAFGTSFYLITNGLLVNLIGIAVADSIHILNAYQTERKEEPLLSKNAVIRRVMSVMWRPVTITTLTTIAGFLALGASTTMPPVRYFGLFGAVGVCVAWVLSILLLPALLAIWPDRAPGALSGKKAVDGGSRPAPLRSYGRFILTRPVFVLCMGAVGALVGIAGAMQVTVDDATIDNFKQDTAIHIADDRINSAMDGINYLDILIESERQGLYDPDTLRRIEALQLFLEGLPHVGGTTSLVDYVKQLNRAVNAGDPAAYVIPDDPNMIAQLFFLYNMSAAPTDFDDEVSREFSKALVRTHMSASIYRDNKHIIPAIETYLAETFADADIQGTATGRVTVDYYWVNGIEQSNLFSVALSFGAIFIVSALLFRSFAGGVIAILPVAYSVLLVYAVMGFAEVPLGVGTSMFAAIAIGLAIDFSIHTLERIRRLVGEFGYDKRALEILFTSTGRALLLNFLAVAGGFGVLALSSTPPLIKFGSLVAVGVAVAFISALTFIPAIVTLVRPRFLITQPRGRNP